MLFSGFAAECGLDEGFSKRGKGGEIVLDNTQRNESVGNRQGASADRATGQQQC